MKCFRESHVLSLPASLSVVCGKWSTGVRVRALVDRSINTRAEYAVYAGRGGAVRADGILDVLRGSQHAESITWLRMAPWYFRNGSLVCVASPHCESGGCA